jgi:hypothetical protein
MTTLSEYRTLMGLRVPASLYALVEEWAAKQGHDPADILRSLLNQGLVYYAQEFPRLAHVLGPVIEDLRQMAPEGATVRFVRPVEAANGTLEMRYTEQESRAARVGIELDVHPELAALLKGVAEGAHLAVGEMLLTTWCLDAVQDFHERHNEEMVRTVLAAWHAHGVPESLRADVEALSACAFGTCQGPVQ